MRAALRLFVFVSGITSMASLGLCNPALFISSNIAQPLNTSQMFSLTGDPFAVELNNNTGATGLTPQTPAEPRIVETSSTVALDVPSTFTMASIDCVVVQWGTLFADPLFQGSMFFVGTQDEAPEPATWGFVGGVLAMLGAGTYRRQRHNT